jgi:putative two-component system response regulator
MERTILFVDDEPAILSSIRRSLKVAKVDWNCEFVLSGKEALNFCRESTVDLIVTDGKMPEMSGNELLEKLRNNPESRDIPTIMLSGYFEDTLRMKALEMGIVEFLNKPIIPGEFILRLRNVLRLKTISDELKIANKDLIETRMQIIRRLGKAAEYKDDDTGRHVIRVAHYSRIIADGMRLSPDVVELIFQTAPMHDIGKIGIPDNILKKPGVLDPGELEVMRQHSSLGEDVLIPLAGEELAIYKRHSEMGEDILGEENTPLLKMASVIAASNHEKWDGHGYPRGLKGEEIPLEARIIEELEGNHLDPNVVVSFNRNFDKIIDIQKRMGD